MNYYESSANNTADGFSPEQQAKGWPYIDWRDIFDRLTDGEWLPEPVRREFLTYHLAHRDQGPGTRDAVAILIDGAIEDGVLEERDGGEQVVLNVEQREIVEVDVDDESTMTLAYYVTPKL